MNSLNGYKQDDLEHQMKISLKTSLFIVFISCFICYSNTIDAEFVYDDT